MAQRIETVSKASDAGEQMKKKHLEESGFSRKIYDVKVSDVYTII